MKMQTLQPILAVLVLFFAICSCNSSLKLASKPASETTAVIYPTALELPDSFLRKWRFKNNEKDTLIAKKILSLAGNEIDNRNFRQAFQLTRLAGDILDNYMDTTKMSMAIVYLNLGICYIQFEENEKGFDYLDLAYKMMINQKDTSGIEASRIYAGKGLSLIGVCEFERGLEMFKKAKVIKDIHKQTYDIQYADILSGIGVASVNIGDLKNAIIYNEKSFHLREKLFGINELGYADGLLYLGLAKLYPGKIDSSILLTEKAIHIYNQDTLRNKLNLCAAYGNIGYGNLISNNYEKSIYFYETALGLLKSLKGDSFNDYANIYYNLAHANIIKNDYSTAAVFFQEGVKIYSTGMVSSKCGGVDWFYEGLGVAYRGLFDLENARLYTEKTIKMRLDPENPYNDRHGAAVSYIELCRLDNFMDKFEEAKKSILEAISIFEDSTTYDRDNLVDSYLEFGRIEQGLKNYQMAINLQHKALSFCKDEDCLQEIRGAYKPYMYEEIAENYLELGQADSAEYYASRALDICFKYNSNNKTQVSSLCKTLARVSYRKGDILNALKGIDEGLKWLGYNSIDNVKNNYDLVRIYYFLEYKGFLLTQQFRQTENKIYSIQADSVFNDALTVLREIRQSILRTESIQDLIENTIFLNEYAALVKYIRGTERDLRDAFLYSERSKSTVLRYAFQEAIAKQVAGIPDRELKMEMDLRFKKDFYQKMIDTNPISEKVKQYQDSLFSVELEYQDVINRIQQNYPQYYQLKYSDEVVDIDYIQRNLLQPNQSLLEYLVGDSSIFAFLVRQDTFIVREIKHDFPLEQWVADMVQGGINGYHPLPDTDTLKRDTAWIGACDRKYTRSAYELYKKLVAPVAAWMTDTVIIVPDGVLGYVPFEALLTAMPANNAIGRFSSYGFLLKTKQISYCYSATLLREMREKQHLRADAKGLFAMAPFFKGDVEKLKRQVDAVAPIIAGTKRDALAPLDASGKEVATIAKLMGGDAVFGSAASVEMFRERAEAYRILHLSTHGKANDQPGDYAYLAFGVPDDTTSGKLYARDLYNYSLNADMVVLSACETGLGKLRRGEGIISLARAFAYAGAKSIFPTLWQVSDTRTAELMGLFYENLKGGMAKDAALCQAKLDYLKNNKGSSAHPYYWAAMIGIGDMRAVHR